jgi:hypothetical protein
MRISKKKPGRKAKRLKAEGVDWQDAMKYALSKPKPKVSPKKS